LLSASRAELNRLAVTGLTGARAIYKTMISAPTSKYRRLIRPDWLCR
jgi:hypothetical protein